MAIQNPAEEGNEKAFGLGLAQAAQGPGAQMPVAPAIAAVEKSTAWSEKSALCPSAPTKTSSLTPSEEAQLAKQRRIDEIKITFFDLYKYATPLDLAIVAVCTLCAMVAGATVPVGPIVGARLYLAFSQVETQDHTSLAPLIRQYTMYFVYLFIITWAAWMAATAGFIHTGARVTRKMKAAYFAAVLRQNMAVFDDVGAGSMLANLTADTNLIQEALSSKLAVSIGAMGNLITTMAVCFSLDWILTFITLWSTLLGCAVLYIGGVATARYSGRSIDALAEGTAVVEEGLGTIKSTTALGMQKFIQKTYAGWLDKSAKNGYVLKMLNAALIGICVASGYLNVSLAFWQGSKRIADGAAPFVNVITITMIVKSAAFCVLGVGANMESFTNGVAAARRLYRMIERVSPIDSSSEEGIVPNHLVGAIELRNVRHIYPSRPTAPVLEEVSITFPAGQMTAIVGQSGSGKSSIASLISRYYDPLEGGVFLDNINITALQIRWLRQQLRIVAQEPFLFNKSVYENISYGLVGPAWQNTSESLKRKLVEEAAKVAQAHDFIMKLPQGYKTLVGSKASRLSGGQAQRVAIARALVGQPGVLILDEATSSLDTVTEARLLAAINESERYRACTKIVIAHRLSTIRDANQIVVLRQGHVVETGQHSDLMERQGTYADLVRAQNMVHEDDTSGDRVVNKEKTMETTTQIESVEKDDAVFLASEEIDLRHGSYSLTSLVKFGFRLNKEEWVLVAVGLACSVVAGVEEPASAILFGESIEAISTNLNHPHTVQSRGGFFAIFFFVLAVTMLLVFGAQGIIFAYCSEKMITRARSLALNQLLRMDMAFFDKKRNSAGALASFLQSSARDLEGVSGNALSVILICISTLFCGIIAAFAYGWKLSLVCLALMPFSLGSGYLGTWLAGEFEKNTEVFNNQAAEFVNETLIGIRTVAAMTREGEAVQHYRQILNATTTRALKANLVTSFLHALANSVYYGSMTLSFWYGTRLFLRHEYTLSQFIVIQSSMLMSAYSAGLAFSWTPSIGKAKRAAAMLLRLLDEEPSIEPFSQYGQDPGAPKGRIEFGDVSFVYPTRPDRPALNHLSLTIPPGASVAFVGATGAGKSTIVAMLERFYDPTSGAILLDSRPISSLNVARYRRLIGLVSQEPTLYSGSIKMNLIIGLEDDSIQPSDGDIEHACKQANIYDFIMSLPDQFETEVGNRGSQLSVGQKQRVALARALLRRPTILVLDEATSALDSESETLIQEALEKAREGRTTITIAHRLSTVVKADTIFVLHDGSIAEAGTHNELMARKGRYFKLFMASTTGQVF